MNEPNTTEEHAARFWASNKDRVLRVMCAILANPNIDPLALSEAELIERAENIVSTFMIDVCGEEY